jgi:hypothetical protein
MVKEAKEEYRGLVATRQRDPYRLKEFIWKDNSKEIRFANLCR